MKQIGNKILAFLAGCWKNMSKDEASNDLTDTEIAILQQREKHQEQTKKLLTDLEIKLEAFASDFNHQCDALEMKCKALQSAAKDLT